MEVLKPGVRIRAAGVACAVACGNAEWILNPQYEAQLKKYTYIWVG